MFSCSFLLIQDMKKLVQKNYSIITENQRTEVNLCITDFICSTLPLSIMIIIIVIIIIRKKAIFFLMIMMIMIIILIILNLFFEGFTKKSCKNIQIKRGLQ